MAHLRSKDSWRQHLASKGAYAMAEMIIGEMVGYRSTSKHRADDLDGLCKAIQAIIELTNAQKAVQ